MRRLGAWASTLGDRVNPVAVKEFRQAVQSRWVIAVLLLFLLLNLVVIGGYLMFTPDAATDESGGRGVFSVLLSFLMITCIAFVPAYAGIRLALERNNADIDLLFVTTITPGAIARGKYVTAMALTLLLFSVCMPFMILTYLLRGIDLPTIFGILGLGFALCALANALGLFAGTVSGSWLIRGLVICGVLMTLIYMTGLALAAAHEMLIFGGGITGLSSWWWAGLGICLVFELLVIGLLYVLAVALMSPKASNRMFVPRVYITATLLFTGAIMYGWSCVVADEEPLQVWIVTSGIALAALLVAAVGERDSWGVRVRRTIPRNPLSRALAFVFFTGSAGGIIWCVLLFLVTVLAAFAWTGLRPNAGNYELLETSGYMALFFGYILCYCLTTAALRPVLFRTMPTPHLSVIALFLGAVMCLVPCLIAFFVEQYMWSNLPAYMLGSPMVLTTEDNSAIYAAGGVVAVWLAMIVAASLSWGRSQWEQFVPCERGQRVRGPSADRATAFEKEKQMNPRAAEL